MKKLTVLGLGYVGLPLAVEFGKLRDTVGFDINSSRVKELQSGKDSTREIESDELKISKFLTITDNIDDIKDSQIYIVTVPTPIDKDKKPDLTPLIKVSQMLGGILKKGDLVIYESTVFPGCTEEICVPELEKTSNLKFNQDFYCGYSPERINPGDKVRTLTKITKVTSGSTPEIAIEVDELYKSIITAGTHMATSLKIAEASKIIENCQRDLNISFVNELSLIFDRIGIDTNEVIDAAGTKWNFLKFRPGLVGGHCIGVDPYYMVHKAEQLGYYPDVILSGRRVNEQIGAFVANKVVKLMIRKGIAIKNADVLILGATFKENCPDIRNSRVIDIVDEMKGFGCQVTICDTWADKEEVYKEYEIEISNKIPNKKYDAIILAVGHQDFIQENLLNYTNNVSVIYDVKSVLDRNIVDARL